jgi:hypothetical protein
MSGRQLDDVTGLVHVAIGVGHCCALTAFLAVIVFAIIRLVAGTG